MCLLQVSVASTQEELELNEWLEVLPWTDIGTELVTRQIDTAGTCMINTSLGVG